MLKQKRTLWIALAVVFVAVLFFVKNKTIFENSFRSAVERDANRLAGGRETLENLVNKDTDADGILDWEESLWGTDKNKKETTPGTPDTVAIEKLKIENKEERILPEDISSGGDLTETDKFSRELLATIATLNQSGDINEATIEALSASLSEKIGNPATRKVFSAGDIKITTDESYKSFSNYRDALNNVQKIYTVKYTVLDVLGEFSADENNVDASLLDKLDPIIEQTKKIIDALVKISAPKSVSSLHLKAINSLQGLLENLNDLKLYDKDAVIFLGAVSQYTPKVAALESDLSNLEKAIEQKINN